MKIQLTIIFVCLSFWGSAQVGINNTDPKAILDITASNAATPSNTDGLLIPRVDEFPVTDPTAAQDGMMVFVTGAGTPSKGFYYWDNAGTSWVNVNNGGDSDWYEEGTTTAPNNINDDIFTQGNVAIGKNIANYSLDIESTGDRGINTLVTGNSNARNYGHYVENSKNGIWPQYGTYNKMIGTGSGSQYGSYQYITPYGNSDHYGSYNYLTGYGSPGFGDKIGSYQNIDYAGGGSHYGSYNRLSGGGNGTHYGSYNKLSGVGLGEQIGNYNSLTGGGSGNAKKYGSYNTLSGSGTGNYYGNYSNLTGTGSGSKYGSYNTISITSGGLHYGVYSDVQKNSGYAGYFIGRMSLGNTTSNRYRMPAADGAANYIMQTNGSGQLSFVNPATIGTDNQNLTGATLSGTSLRINIENGNFTTVNLAPLQDGTGTDDQNITGSGLAGTNLTIGIENGTSQIIDLSSLQDGTGTDNQNLTGATLTGTSLQIDIQNGSSTTVDLVGLQDGTGTDDQTIDTFSFNTGTNILTLEVENDGLAAQTVDLSTLQDGTGTDNQNLTGATLTGTSLQIDIENGSSTTVDLVGLQDGTGTDEQTIDTFSFNTGTNILTLEVENDGLAAQTVNLSSLQDGTGTDNQNITGSGLAGTNLTIGIENGTSQIIDLSSLQDGTGTDNQTIDTFSFDTSTNVLTLEVENDGVAPQAVNLSTLNDADWYEEGTTTAPNNINDDIYTQGNVAIGKNIAIYSLDIESAGTRGVNTLITGGSSSVNYGHKIENNSTGGGDQYATHNSLSGTGSGGQYGSYQDINNTGNGIHYGSYNTLTGTGAGLQYGSWQSITNSGNGTHYGMYSSLTSTGTGIKYGMYSTINNTSGGTHYGVYSNAQKASGYAGYFVGRMSLGNTNSNRYLMPAADGTANYIMQTNGSGQVNFVDPTTVGTDNQNLTGATLTGTSLQIDIENGSSTTVNLAGLQDGNTQNTLDQAYDEGGAGAGRTINTTDGAVLLSGTDGLRVRGNSANIVIANLDEGESGIHFKDSENTTEYAYINYDSNNTNNSLNLYVDSVTPLMTLDDNQSVGIGTTTPDSKLSVIGAFSTAFETAETNKLVMAHGGSNAYINVVGSGRLDFRHEGSTGMTFTDANRLGIGTTSPSFTLDVMGSNDADYVAQIYNTSTDPNADGLKIRVGRSTAPTASTVFVSFFDGTNTSRGRVTGNGSGVQYLTTSDRRLKTNIIDIKNALYLINKIQPRKYEYKTQLGIEEYGFIAQELQQLYPQAVSGSPDSDVKTNPMMVDYSRLTPLLTAGIKELNEKVEKLEKENQELKQQLSIIEILEARLSALENNTNQLNLISEKK